MQIIHYVLNMIVYFRLNESKHTWIGTLDVYQCDPKSQVTQSTQHNTQNTQHNTQPKTKSTDLEVNFENNVRKTVL